AIGIGALFSLLSFAQGVRVRVVRNWLSSASMTNVLVTERAPEEPRRRRPFRPRSDAPPLAPGAKPRPLDEGAVREIAAIAGVRFVQEVVRREVEPAGRTDALAGGVKAAPPLEDRRSLAGPSPSPSPAAGSGGGAADASGPPEPVAVTGF